MMKQIQQARTDITPAPVESRAWRAGAALRTAILAAPFALTGLASAADTGLEFNVDDVKTKALAILGVGVAIALAFAVYKVGKRASAKM